MGAPFVPCQAGALPVSHSSTLVFNGFDEVRSFTEMENIANKSGQAGIA
jgi:hypothetical protein